MIAELDIANVFDSTRHARPAGNDRQPGRHAPGSARGRVSRRMLQLAGLVVFVLAVVTLVPGLASVRTRLATASPAWLVVAAGLEVLSCLAYIVAFRAALCARMSR